MKRDATVPAERLCSFIEDILILLFYRPIPHPTNILKVPLYFVDGFILGSAFECRIALLHKISKIAQMGIVGCFGLTGCYQPFVGILTQEFMNVVTPVVIAGNE